MIYLRSDKYYLKGYKVNVMSKLEILKKLAGLEEEMNKELKRIESEGNTVYMKYNPKTNKDELYVIKDIYGVKN